MKMLKKELLRFGRFIYERQAVWHRRFIEKLPPSKWTRDPVLRRYKFTNIYRELDRGTVYFYRELGLHAVTFEETAWRSVAYRFVNRVSSFERLALPHHNNWNTLTRRDFLREVRGVPAPFFTSAHQNFPPRYVGQDLRERYVELVTSFGKTLDDLACTAPAMDPDEFHTELKKRDGLGAFRATEVMKDLMMLQVLPYGPNNWTYPGPGALAGLAHLTDNVRPSKTDAKELIRELTDGQDGWLPEAWQDVRLHEYPVLSRCNLEHALCEYFKYRRARDEGGRPRVNYNADAEILKRLQTTVRDPLLRRNGLPYVIPNPWRDKQ